MTILSQGLNADPILGNPASHIDSDIGTVACNQDGKAGRACWPVTIGRLVNWTQSALQDTLGLAM